MLFFRSEEMLEAWCRSRVFPRGAVATLDQLWRLAVIWNAGRLELDPRRPGPAQAREMLAGVGLSGPFWDPESDAFA
jgi:hypothetical protein